MNRQYSTKAKHSHLVMLSTLILWLSSQLRKMGKWTYQFTNWTSVVQGWTSANQPSRPTHTITSDVPVTYEIPSVPSSHASDVLSESKSPVPGVTDPRRNPPRNKKTPDRLNLWYVMSAVKNCIQLDEVLNASTWFTLFDYSASIVYLFSLCYAGRSVVN